MDLIKVPELIDEVLDGQIEDAKTVVGALYVTQSLIGFKLLSNSWQSSLWQRSFSKGAFGNFHTVVLMPYYVRSAALLSTGRIAATDGTSRQQSKRVRGRQRERVEIGEQNGRVVGNAAPRKNIFMRFLLLCGAAPSVLHRHGVRL